MLCRAHVCSFHYVVLIDAMPTQLVLPFSSSALFVCRSTGVPGAESSAGKRL